VRKQQSEKSSKNSEQRDIRVTWRYARTILRNNSTNSGFLLSLRGLCSRQFFTKHHQNCS